MAAKRNGEEREHGQNLNADDTDQKLIHADKAKSTPLKHGGIEGTEEIKPLPRRRVFATVEGQASVTQRKPRLTTEDTEDHRGPEQNATIFVRGKDF
jgi:hypothetical protein